MFETFAVLSTLSCVIIFVVLIQIDRAGRREESEKAQDGTHNAPH
jgi:hypothetical protein